MSTINQVHSMDINILYAVNTTDTQVDRLRPAFTPGSPEVTGNTSSSSKLD